MEEVKIEEEEEKEGRVDIVRKYSFDFIDPNTHFTYDKGYLELIFMGYLEENVDKVIEKVGEKIKNFIKDNYSVNVYGKKPNTKTFMGKIHPIKMLNFQELKTPFQDDSRTYVIMESISIKKGIATFDIE